MDKLDEQGDHNYCLEFDFKTAKKVEKWFPSEEEARYCIARFQTAFGLDLKQPVQKLYDCCRSCVNWNNDTNIPFIIASNEVQESPWQPNEAKPTNNSQIRYVVAMNKLVNFPTYKSKTHFRRKIASHWIRQLISKNSLKLKMEISFHLKISKQEQNAERMENDGKSRNEKPLEFYSSYEEARDAVRRYEKETSTKYIRFTKSVFDTSKSLIRWDQSTLTPYILLSTNYFECHVGRDRNKVMNDKRLTKKCLHEPMRKRRSKPTKKINCKAKVSIKEVIRFPQFKILSLKKTQIIKARVGIRRGLASNDKTMIKEYACLVSFPENSDHTGHVVKKFENDDLNRIEGVFNCFVGNTLDDLLAAGPYIRNRFFLTCKICSKKCESVGLMEAHMDDHFKQCYFFKLGLQEVSLLPCFGQCLGEKRKKNHYHCPFCHEMSTNRTTISTHVNTYKGECLNEKEKPSSPQPMQQNDDSQSLDKSTDITRSQWEVDPCFTFFVDQTFEEYVQQFSPDSDCPLCLFQSSPSDLLEQHLISNHLDHSLSFMCNHRKYCCLPCKRQCRDKVVKKSHTHFHCPFCKKVIGSSSNFKQHIAATMGMCSEKRPLHEIPIVKPVAAELQVQDYETVELSSDDENQYNLVPPASTTNFVSSTSNIMSGYEVLQDDANGHISHTFEYSDSGRNQNDMVLPPQINNSGSEEKANNPRKRKRGRPKQSAKQGDPAPLAEDTFAKLLIAEMRKVTGTKRRKIQEDLVRIIQSAAGSMNSEDDDA